MAKKRKTLAQRLMAASEKAAKVRDEYNAAKGDAPYTSILTTIANAADATIKANEEGK